jgi:polyvinyl alcohol dehydrogenase (cytochrome)
MAPISRIGLAALGLLLAFPVFVRADDQRHHHGRTSSWPSAGRDSHNTRHQPHEVRISPRTAPDLKVQWVFETGGDVSATPAVDSRSVYVPDWAGNLFSIDRRTGALNWSRKVSDYTGVPGDRARTTPAIHGRRLILGNQQGFLGQGSGAWVFAVDKRTGEREWATKVDDHPAAIITQSAVVHGDRVYVGVSSLEEAYAAFIPGYPCCSFRGSLLSLDVDTGEILWRTYTVPDVPGYSGNAVWGSTPVIDQKRDSVYVATGNNYTVPNEVLLSLDQLSKTDPENENAVRACVERDQGNHFDAIVAMDLRTGKVKWSRAVIPYDAWTVSCIMGLGNPENCPSPAGPDHDFAQGPALFRVRTHRGHHRDLLGAGQKSGVYWALDPDDGRVVWRTQVGPGGELGGLQWGSAVDGSRIYAAVSNSNSEPWELVRNGRGTGETIESGFWSALDASTGRILWQTADPNGAMDPGAVTVANGVVFGGSLSANPASDTMFALDARSGAILWSFASGATVNSGAAVVDGRVYWGSGYSNLGLGTANKKLFAFTVK